MSLRKPIVPAGRCVPNSRSPENIAEPVQILWEPQSDARRPALAPLAALLAAALAADSAAQPAQPQDQAQPQEASQQRQQTSPQQQAPQQQQASQQQQQASQRQQDARSEINGCAALPGHEVLTSGLREIVAPGDPSVNGGLGNHMWAVIVDRAGTICAVARSGENPGDQWPGSRAIAAGKAFTANAFSLPAFAISTANLYWSAQPGKSLYGMEAANPMNGLDAYGGPASTWGSADDPLAGRRVGGTVVFGGGLALYNPRGNLLGALGVSGDESCTDHVVAWKLRDELNLDSVPNGVARHGSDNIIHDITVDPASGKDVSASGYGHPTCSPDTRRIAERLPAQAPLGSTEE